MTEPTEKTVRLVKQSMSLLHAVQTGVAYEHARGSDDGSPKHLRVGVNNALCLVGAVEQLLIDKGICTLDEILQAHVNVLEREVAKYHVRNPGVTFT